MFNYIRAIIILGIIYNELGDFDQALIYHNEALKL